MPKDAKGCQRPQYIKEAVLSAIQMKLTMEKHDFFAVILRQVSTRT